MNQDPRGVQTPPRPQPKTPPTKRPAPQPAPVYFDVSRSFWILLSATVVLLVVMLVTMTVLLIADGSSSALPTPPAGGGQSQTNQPNQPNNGGGGNSTSKPPALSSKTGISLPSTTKSGSYACTPASATDISGDSGIVSQAIALIDVTNGRAVASKNGAQRIYPASMTKVMTLLVACENAKSATELLTVTENMVAKYKTTDGASVAIEWKVGQQVTVEDALYLVIYESDTYACWLLSEYVAGSEADFVRMMNERASALGLSGTHFENSTGLYHDNHYTTCFDMAAIMAAAMNNEAARKVLTSTTQYTADIRTAGKQTGAIPMYSAWYTSRLEKYRYPSTAPYYAGNGSDIRLIAGKTGYETIPTNCFVTAGQNDETGTLFVCVQVGRISTSEPSVDSRTSTDDTRETYQRYATY